MKRKIQQLKIKIMHRININYFSNKEKKEEKNDNRAYVVA